MTQFTDAFYKNLKAYYNSDGDVCNKEVSTRPELLVIVIALTP